MVWARRIVHGSLLPWSLFAMTVPMMMAADDKRLVMEMILGVWSYGPLALLCSLAARMLWTRGHRRAAAVAVAVPLTIMAALVLLISWDFVVGWD
jgi:drug/metabolite transporter (DMT)-like permease